MRPEVYLKYCAIAVFVFIIGFEAHSQSDWKQTLATTDSLNDVRFVNADTGWVVGNSGRIMHTMDGGKNWHTQNSTTSYNLRSIFFVNDSTGWIAGNGNVVIRTKDGGNTWHQLTAYEDVAILSIIFVDSLHGWYLARPSSTPQKSFVRTTSDGGVTWTQQAELPHASGIFFSDINNGWATGQDEVLHTSDGGKSWKSQSFSLLNKNEPNPGEPVLGHSVALRSIYFVDENHGWAVGSISTYVRFPDIYRINGIILKTDGWR